MDIMYLTGRSQKSMGEGTYKQNHKLESAFKEKRIFNDEAE